jgi:hypothetical protein
MHDNCSFDLVDGRKLSYDGIGHTDMDDKIITIGFWDMQGSSALYFNLEITPGLFYFSEFLEGRRTLYWSKEE